MPSDTNAISKKEANDQIMTPPSDPLDQIHLLPKEIISFIQEELYEVNPALIFKLKEPHYDEFLLPAYTHIRIKGEIVDSLLLGAIKLRPSTIGRTSHWRSRCDFTSPEININWDYSRKVEAFTHTKTLEFIDLEGILKFSHLIGNKSNYSSRANIKPKRYRMLFPKVNTLIFTAESIKGLFSPITVVSITQNKTKVPIIQTRIKQHARKRTSPCPSKQTSRSSTGPPIVTDSNSNLKDKSISKRKIESEKSDENVVTQVKLKNPTSIEFQYALNPHIRPLYICMDYRFDQYLKLSDKCLSVRSGGVKTIHGYLGDEKVYRPIDGKLRILNIFRQDQRDGSMDTIAVDSLIEQEAREIANHYWKYVCQAL
ncbi:uncharacterized protein I206_102134 [Kwoniella pini CBS 10737]|uniref:Uncharacterized protein n=1 Tax=Kwoniella pini CBS 10737 TaxID=1296096 RepID=A0A1B9HUQ8_9TREE|nr:uncharacterized protein I206_06773 [Kwoniella pini CBS 10737]OCF46999.1 hypothetical protein I206_06773 [Kwoniella pini CBS 10737]